MSRLAIALALEALPRQLQIATHRCPRADETLAELGTEYNTPVLHKEQGHTTRLG